MEQSDHVAQQSKSDRPHWSLVTSFWVAVSTIALIAIAELLFIQKAVWVELEALAGIVGIMMTAFYTYVLYHGVKFSENETISLTKELGGNPLDLGELGNLASTRGGYGFGHLTAAGASEGLAGLLLGLLLDIIVTLLLAVVFSVLLWLGINLLVSSVIIVAIPFFYVFKRSVFFVMRHIGVCHGNLLKSFGYGFGYAAFKTAILCLIVFAAHEVSMIIRAAI